MSKSNQTDGPIDRMVAMNTKHRNMAICILILSLMILACGLSAGKVTMTPPSASPSVTFAPTPKASNVPAPALPTSGSTTTGVSTLTKLGPTLDYVNLATHYLTPFTPFPTTRVYSASTPMPTPNSLSHMYSRRLPSNWTPTPPPIIPPLPPFPESPLTPRPTPTFDYTAGFIQGATDLMNLTDADEGFFVQYVDAWAPGGKVMSGASWILKDDFDNNGQAEWLVSVSTYRADWQAGGYYSQLIILFEKSGDIYKPMHYEDEVSATRGGPTKVLLVDDLNKDGHQEIVLSSLNCGASTCSQILEIDSWDGRTWTRQQLEADTTYAKTDIKFVDYYHDGKTEIVLTYHTVYEYNTAYPDRLATDIYGWKNGELVKLEELLSPNTEPYPVMLDVFSALSSGKIDDALKLAQPNRDRLHQTCTQLETYTAIEVMLADAVQNKPEATQSTLAQINVYRQQPDNGFTYAANILLQAYQPVRDPAAACEAMKRFIIDNMNNDAGFKFFDGSVVLPVSEYNFCPLVPFNYR